MQDQDNEPRRIFPPADIQAQIMAFMEEENRQLKLKNKALTNELEAMRAELMTLRAQLYTPKSPIALDENDINDMLNEIDQKEQEHKEQQQQSPQSEEEKDEHKTSHTSTTKHSNNQSSKPSVLQSENNKNAAKPVPLPNGYSLRQPRRINWDTVEDALRRHSVGDIKEQIVNHSVNLNESDRKHNQLSLLMKASMYGCYNIAELLVHSDEARIDAKSENGLRAIDYAEQNANPHIAQLLHLEEFNQFIGSKLRRTMHLIHRQKGVTQCALNRLPTNVLDAIVQFLIYCVQNKLPFSDDMMALAWAHIQNQSNRPIDSQLFQLLLSTNVQIMNDPSMDQRDWAWLENYLIPSTLWLNTYPHDEKRPLFNEIYIAAEDGEKKQSQRVLLRDIQRMRQRHNELWKRLKKFKVKNCMNPTGSDEVSIMRQDEIMHGITATHTKRELLGNKPFGQSTNFNPIEHYDFAQYLNRLYFRACTVDEYFQNDAQFIVKQIRLKDPSIAVRYRRGPIKLLQRCVTKVESKYSNMKWPKSAHLLDINRCSLTFDDLPSMMKGIDMFVSMVNSGETCIKQIVRCKNLWNGDLFTDSSPKYSDIKFNVKIDIGNNIVIIAEVQILLKLMESIKGITHRYYGIERQYDFIVDYMENAPVIMDKESQLFTYACTGDRKSLLYMIVTYNISPIQLLAPYKDTGKTILSKICEFDDVKLFKLLQTMFTEQQFIKALQRRDNSQEHWSPIGEALNANSKQILRLLCKQYPKLMTHFHFKDAMHGRHALHFAAQNGNLEQIKWHFQQMQHLSIEEKTKRLQVRDKRGYIPLLSACNYSRTKSIEYMLQWAANENIQESIVTIKDLNGGNTPLMLCCYKGNKETVHALLRSVVSPKLRLSMILEPDHHGLTPLIYAALSKAEHSASTQCASILLEYIQDTKLRLAYLQRRSTATNKTAYEHAKDEKNQLLMDKLTEWRMAAEKQ